MEFYREEIRVEKCSTSIRFQEITKINSQKSTLPDLQPESSENATTQFFQKYLYQLEKKFFVILKVIFPLIFTSLDNIFMDVKGYNR